MKKLNRGLTLIELMVAVAIIGILAGVAYPSYVDFVTRSNRAEPQRELMRIANLQEMFYVDNRAYTDDMKDLGLGADPFITESGNYSIDATVNSAKDTFVLKATALGQQASADAVCLNMQITETGAKSATSAKCWE
ncbi:prepilin-type N-terminal cleavage/methylation domain-containing protein [Thalassotalea sp. LPB0316]|uniref:type IV pilin protein n=1 Tax=Thalassotalea sp. LPB0316 TaxID=2769490 RepID=UPI0018666F09|nr:type IV pilin protein [Thalassotalea sp. LPB0316]QOL25771.1 prepilin-type N-terminal cleavage/methylation domain-containing protein [Thalassotalea sp. LPB0316]